MARFKPFTFIGTVVVVLSYLGSVGVISNLVTSQCTTSEVQCQNGGACISSGTGGWYCTCPPSYTGSYCQNTAETVCTLMGEGQCQNGGTCVLTGTGEWSCFCGANYTGRYCENTTTYLWFEELYYSTLETAGRVTLTVFRTGDLNKNTIVRVQTFDDSAMHDFNYVEVSKVLNFDPFVTNLSVEIDLIYSSTTENLEFWAVLSDPTGGAVQSPYGIALIYVLDTDSETVDVFSVTDKVIALESESPVEVWLLRSGLIDEMVQISVSTRDDSMSPVSPHYAPFKDRLLTFRPWQYKLKVRVNLTDDTILEDSRSFYLEYSLYGEGNPPRRVEIRILDDDVPPVYRPIAPSSGDQTYVFFAGTLPYVTNEARGEVQISIYRIGNLNRTTEIAIDTSDGTALLGEDYQEVMTDTISMSQDMDVHQLRIPIEKDLIYEETEEFFFVTLTVLEGGQLGRPNEGTVRVNIRPDQRQEEMTTDHTSATTLQSTTLQPTTLQSTTAEQREHASSAVIPIVIGVIVGVIVLFGLILVFLYFCCKRRASRPKEPGVGDVPLTTSRKLAHENSYLNRGFSSAKGQGSIAPMSYVDPVTREYPRDKLQFHEEIGAGAFAVVYRAEALGIHRPGLVSTVAVKMLKKTASETDKTDFMKELDVFKMLDRHDNVMSLLGCCTTEEPFYIILDFMPHGNLQSYLQRVRTGKERDHPGYLDPTQRIIQPEEVLLHSSQVARGMEYLGSKECIHRDLATRNILLGEDHVCKVSDFGLARDVAGDQQYEMKSKGRVPVRWLAPECLFHNTYTSQSDVWSFGVLMWELVTQGSHPYPGMSSQQVIKQVQHGYRLPKPDCCSQEIYDLMYSCWKEDPEDRPTFQNLRRSIEDMLSNAQGYLLMDCFQENDYLYMTPGQESEEEDGLNE